MLTSAAPSLCQELRRLADSGVVLDGSQQEALRRGLEDRVALIHVGSVADARGASRPG